MRSHPCFEITRYLYVLALPFRLRAAVVDTASQSSLLQCYRDKNVLLEGGLQAWRTVADVVAGGNGRRGNQRSTFKYRPGSRSGTDASTRPAEEFNCRL